MNVCIWRGTRVPGICNAVSVRVVLFQVRHLVAAGRINDGWSALFPKGNDLLKRQYLFLRMQCWSGHCL